MDGDGAGSRRSAKSRGPLGYDGKLTVTVIDEATGQPLPVRMELRRRPRPPMRIKAEGAVSRDDYIAIRGSDRTGAAPGFVPLLPRSGARVPYP